MDENSKFGEEDKEFHVEYPDPDSAKLDDDIIDSHRNQRSTEKEMDYDIKLNYKAHFGSEESVSAARKHRATNEEMRTPSEEFYKMRRSDGY